jgi:hypothetical protein
VELQHHYWGSVAFLEAIAKAPKNVILIPPQSGGRSMTFTNAFYIETIFEIASSIMMVDKKITSQFKLERSVPFQTTYFFKIALNTFSLLNFFVQKNQS